MEQSTDIAELAKALSLAQSEIKGAVKDAANPFFKSHYADLSSVWEACRAAITKNGLSIMQTGNDTGDTVTVITQLMHSSGQWIRGSFNAKPVKADPQGIGSCITYLRRYSLAAMVGVAPEDDDGNAASMPTVKAKTEIKKTYTQEELPPFDETDQFFADEPPHPSEEVSAPVSEYGTANFGQHKGKTWDKIPQLNLAWYKKALMESVVDPEKQKFLKANKEALKQVMSLLGEK